MSNYFDHENERGRAFTRYETRLSQLSDADFLALMQAPDDEEAHGDCCGGADSDARPGL